MHAIYCDYNSTTPTDPRVADIVRQVAVEDFANASSAHRLGQRARVRLDDSRAQIASFIGAKPSEIVFTGSGSEADNLAILGSLHAPDARGRHWVTVATEHHAITETAAWTRRAGLEVTVLPTDRLGRVDPEEFARSLRTDTQVASVMLANNEIGTIQPVSLLARLAHERGVVFHTDAVQALGKIPVDVDKLGVDLLSLSSHKFYGPKGIGLLYVRQGIRLAPILHGGGQEMGRRPGTENVPGAAGTAVAMKLLHEDPDEPRRVAAIAAEFQRLLGEKVTDIELFGDPDSRLPNTVAVGFGGVDGTDLMIALDLRGLCVSTGSACTSGVREPSHVLQALGIVPHYAHGSIRFSFGRGSRTEHAAIIADAVAAEVERMRTLPRGGL
ncbi:MAG: cysteine desulfurase family protein [Candidatus Zixiibacteriota bacterium]